MYNCNTALDKHAFQPIITETADLSSAQHCLAWRKRARAQAIISSFGRFLTAAVATVACFYISIIGTERPIITFP